MIDDRGLLSEVRGKHMVLERLVGTPSVLRV